MNAGGSDKSLLLDFVTNARDRYPITESFPASAIQAIDARDEDVVPILVELLNLATRYDDAVDHRGRNCYEGQDLRRQALVVRAIARCAPSPLPVPSLVALLESSTFTRYSAAPGGSPDIDKYDRDEQVERSQDALALGCVLALGRHPLDETARNALQAAELHRSDEVKSGAALALRGR